MFHFLNFALLLNLFSKSLAVFTVLRSRRCEVSLSVRAFYPPGSGAPYHSMFEEAGQRMQDNSRLSIAWWFGNTFAWVLLPIHTDLCRTRHYQAESSCQTLIHHWLHEAEAFLSNPPSLGLTPSTAVAPLGVHFRSHLPVHSRVLDPNFSVQGCGERPASGQKHHLYSVSYSNCHRRGVLTGELFERRWAVSVGEELHQSFFLVRLWKYNPLQGMGCQVHVSLPPALLHCFVSSTRL